MSKELELIAETESRYAWSEARVDLWKALGEPKISSHETPPWGALLDRVRRLAAATPLPCVIDEWENAL